MKYKALLFDVDGTLFNSNHEISKLTLEGIKKTYEKGIKITTKGNGHGFGMSISYARYLAGHGKPWQEILSTFYDGKIVEY